jgi:hypothetical protein
MSTAPGNTEYVRRLYDDVLGWYRSADSKAQVALALDGGFVAILTGAVFTDPQKLQAVLARFNSVTWSLLALMALSWLGSIGAALYCLWSRTYSPAEVRQQIRQAESESHNSSTYPPGPIMWFFQLIEGLDRQKFQATLEAAGYEFEIKTLGLEICILSKNVRTKHVAVNIAFILAAITLILFLAAGTSYVIIAAMNFT